MYSYRIFWWESWLGCRKPPDLFVPMIYTYKPLKRKSYADRLKILIWNNVIDPYETNSPPRRLTRPNHTRCWRPWRETHAGAGTSTQGKARAAPCHTRPHAHAHTVKFATWTQYQLQNWPWWGPPPSNWTATCRLKGRPRTTILFKQTTIVWIVFVVFFIFLML